jgi:thioredoxin 1
MDGTVTPLTTTTFDDVVLRAGRPILVDFWSEACEPCKAMMPVLSQIALKCAGDLRVGTVQRDDAPELAGRFEIMTLPTLIVFIDGAPLKRITGAAGKDRLLEELGEFLHHEGA